jgi:hypothetical protein
MTGRRLEPDVRLRAVALEAFVAADPRILAMTEAEIDRRLTAALAAAAEDLRERAGLNDKPKRKASPKRRPAKPRH